MFQFEMPLRVKVSKNKDFILNMNNYRGAHHRVLTNAKNNYTDIFMNLDIKTPRYDKVVVHYELHPATNRKFDLMNVISVVDKFVMDAIVKRGIIPDDNIKHVPSMPTASVMPVDRHAPRVVVTVSPLH